MIYSMKGAVQHYNWGGTAYLPALLGVPNDAQQPFAELWMGAHPKAPAYVKVGDQWADVRAVIAESPDAILGRAAAQQFENQLPYLFKVLDVRQMLSIQAHPNKAAAAAGFARENAAGVPLDAPFRNYRDNNHKPEIMVALGEFWLLHGFKTADGIDDVFAHVPEFAPLKAFWAEKSLYNLYQKVMTLSAAEVDDILKPLKKRLLATPFLEKNNPDFWAKRAFEDDILQNGHEDVGIFSIYFTNLVQLNAGEGIFQDAGILHAYLEGLNVELMSNSDNVFRGGLTYKHVDVKELLDNLVFAPVVPNILRGEIRENGEEVYKTSAPDFELSRITLNHEARIYEVVAAEPEILLALEGEANLTAGDQVLPLKKGEIAFVTASTAYRLTREGSQTVVVFKATVPAA